MKPVSGHIVCKSCCFIWMSLWARGAGTYFGNVPMVWLAVRAAYLPCIQLQVSILGT